MKLVIISSVIAFLLDGLVSNFIFLNTNLFSCLFSIVSLVLVYPYFKKNNNRFLIYSFVMGLFYDFIYTDTMILNAFTFLLLGYLIKFFFSKINVNEISSNICLILIIIVYRLVVYGALLLFGYLPFDFSLLLKSIYSSLLLNILYCLLGYVLIDYISYKFRIKKLS